MDRKLTDEQKELGEKLTILQYHVVLNLVKGMNYPEAHRAAGGKAKSDAAASVTVSRMLKNANVKAFHNSLIESVTTDTIMGREEALQILSDIARTTIKDVADFRREQVGEDEDGNPVYQTVWDMKNAENMSDVAAGCIDEVAATPQGLKFKKASRANAIKQLSDMQGWNAAKEITLTTHEQALQDLLDADKQARENE